VQHRNSTNYQHYVVTIENTKDTVVSWQGAKQFPLPLIFFNVKKLSKNLLIEKFSTRNAKNWS